jgi:hypothetical protein
LNLNTADTAVTNLRINVLRIAAIVLMLCRALPVSAAQMKWSFTALGWLGAPVIGPKGNDLHRLGLDRLVTGSLAR